MIQGNRFKNYIPYFFLAAFIFVLFPNYFFNVPAAGVDNSWNIALHLAHKYDLVFGKDFVFTYGPLGILSSRHPIAISKWVFIIADAYFLITCFVILKDLFKKHFSYWLMLFIFLCIVAAMYEGIYHWYFYFFLYFLFSAINNPKSLFHLSHAGFLSILSFYVKVSLGISSIAIFLMAVVFLVVRKKIRLTTGLILLAVYFLIIWAGAWLLNVELVGYIQGSLALIDAYNDSMLLPLISRFEIYGFAAAFVMLIMVCFCIYQFKNAWKKKEVWQKADQFFIYGIMLFSVFILFKSAFVRCDGHIFIFFKWITPIAAFFYLYSPQKAERKLALYCSWIILGIAFWGVNAIPGSYLPYKRVLTFSFWPIKIGEIKHYWWGIANYDYQIDAEVKRDAQPNAYKQLTGNHTVDVVPTEISTIYFNGLRYNPRPVIQSYSTYNKYLDELNYNKYTSPDAPDFILFSVSSIDNRYAFFDESKTKLAIFNNYSLAGKVNGDLLLKKRATPAGMHETKEKDTVYATLGEDIELKKTDRLQFSQVGIEYSLWGRLRRVFYQPPSLNITLTFENGQTETYKAIKPILEGGVLINKYVDNEQDFQIFMRSDSKLNPAITKIRFDPVNNMKGFKQEIKLVNTYYAFGEKPASQQQADSLEIAQLLNSLKPVPGSIPAPKQDTFKFGIDQFKTQSQIIRVSGWTYRPAGNNEKYTINAVLQSADTLYVLPTTAQARPDVEAAHNRRDVINSGFNAVVGKLHLVPGDYQLGMLITNEAKDSSWIHLTGSHVVVRKLYAIEKLNASWAVPMDKEPLKYSIDVFEDKQDETRVQGWSLHTDENTNKSNTFLILKSNTATYRISTDKLNRADLPIIYKNPLYAYGGFSVTIPKNELLPGVYTVGIEKTGAAGELMGAALSEKTIKAGVPDWVIPRPVTELPPAQKFEVVIDVLDDKKEYFRVDGWAVQDVKKVQQSIVEIYLKNGKKYYKASTEINLRPDVTASYKNGNNLDNSGFKAKVSKMDLPAGRYQLGIRVYQGDNKGTIRFLDRYIEKK